MPVVPVVLSARRAAGSDHFSPREIAAAHSPFVASSELGSAGLGSELDAAPTGIGLGRESDVISDVISAVSARICPFLPANGSLRG